MRTSKTLARLRRGEVVHCCVLGHFIPYFVNYAAHYGYDCIWLDLEHHAMEQREVQALLSMCHSHDIDCMVRPPTRERTPLTRLLEDGASGFMFPFVSSAGAARTLVSYTKFPPAGNRGLDGGSLDAGYGLDAWKPESTYTQEANRETFIVAQIEEMEAVLNVEEIAAVPGIDCLYIGPADLGLRLRASSNFPAMTISQVVERVAAAAKANGKAWGIWPNSAEDITHYRRMGAQFLNWGDDFALANSLRLSIQELEAALSTSTNS